MPDESTARDVALVLEGKKPLSELLGLERDQLSLLTELAHLYFQEGRYEEARTLFEGLAALEPGNAYLCRALGATHQRLGEAEAALRYYQRAAKLDETEPETWANMGEVLLLGEQLDRGVACLERADQLYRARCPAAPQWRRVKALLARFRRGAPPATR